MCRSLLGPDTESPAGGSVPDTIRRAPSGFRPEGRFSASSAFKEASQQAVFSIASRGNELASINDCQARGIITALKIEGLEIERLVVGAVDMNHLARM